MKLDALLWAINALQTLFALPILARKWKRSHRFKTDFALSRFFGPSLEAPRGVRLVMVGMGFAESRWALALGRQIRALRPDVEIVWAIFDANAVRSAGALPAGQILVLPPFDYAPAVRRWLRRVAPDTVVFLEKFLYANFARTAHNQNIRVGAITARLRDHRGGRYRLGAFYNRWLLEAFDLIGLRSAQESAHLGDLADVPNVRVTGSLKFPPRHSPLSPQRAQELQNWLQDAENRPLFCAGSTREGDEAWILAAFLPLWKRGARLLLAPRKIERAPEIEALCHEAGLKTARRSQPSEKTTAQSAPDVWILDTIGELSTAYGAATATFIGGTLVHTGQNVLEPLVYGLPVFFGPKRGTFGAEQDLVIEKQVGFRVHSPAELEQGWTRALDDLSWRAQVRERALQLAGEGEVAWQTTLDAVLELLPPARA